MEVGREQTQKRFTIFGLVQKSVSTGVQSAKTRQGLTSIMTPCLSPSRDDSLRPLKAFLMRIKWAVSPCLQRGGRL